MSSWSIIDPEPHQLTEIDGNVAVTVISLILQSLQEVVLEWVWGTETPSKRVFKEHLGYVNILCEQFWGIYFFITFGLGNHLQHALVKSEVPDLLSTANGGRKNLPLNRSPNKKHQKKSHGRFKNLVVEDSGKTIETSPGAGFKDFFWYTPIFGEDDIPFWRAYLSGGLVKNHQLEKHANQTAATRNQAYIVKRRAIMEKFSL